MEKQLLPLALLYESDEQLIEGITRLQKLVFLAQKEAETVPEEYSFKAGKYGPYSRPLYDDIDRLVKEGFVDEETEENPFGDEKQVYELTEEGKRVVESATSSMESINEIRQSAKDINETYNSLGFWDLLEYVYESYPNMAVNSELSI